MNEIRCRHLIKQAIDVFALDLSGLVVLTEAASGYYSLTPLIAALAGADRVYSLTRDSRFGTAQDVSDATLAIGQRWGLANRIEVLTDRGDDRISKADIITNLGFVRPLDAALLQRCKRTAVIPLMWETWEYRREDLDLDECRRLGICVLGTNEHHPDLQIFEYIGPLALKLLFEAGIEVFRSTLLVIGSGEFADHVVRAAGAAGAQCSRLKPESIEQDSVLKIRDAITRLDAVIIVEHNDRRVLIGNNGPIKPDELHSLNPALTVVHICGEVQRNELCVLGLNCWPERFAPAGHMSVATDYVGPKPIVDLHTAGLKVGEQLARARLTGLSASEAEFAVLKESSLAQGFVGHHDPLI